jgi:tetratricopeptide (TPR) repeat protein
MNHLFRQESCRQSRRAAAGAANRKEPAKAGRPGDRPTLGLAMIVRDEAENLPFSLGPTARHFDQAVVVDTGSTDGTAEMAAGFGARVVHFEWIDDFAAARNFGLGHMSTDYVLWLDADNSLSLADLGALRDRLDGRPKIVLATELVVPQGDQLWQKRVFPNHPECRFQGAVHEQLVHPADWPVEGSTAVIRHWGYADPAAARRKGQRNLEILVASGAAAGGDFYHLYQTGRTLMNLRYFKEAEEYLLEAVEAGAAAMEPGAAESRADEAVPAGSGSPGPNPGPVNPSLWSHALIALAQVRTRLGLGAQAEAALRRLCAARPGYGPGRAHLGRLLHEAGRFKEARTQLALALAAGCGDRGWGADPIRLGFQTACLLAKAEERLGRAGDAWRAWRAASGIDPAHPEPWVAMAESSMAAGDRVSAKELLGRAIGLAPSHRRALSLSAELEVGS